MMGAVVVSNRADASLGFVPFFGRKFVSRSSLFPMQAICGRRVASAQSKLEAGPRIHACNVARHTVQQYGPLKLCGHDRRTIGIAIATNGEACAYWCTAWHCLSYDMISWQRDAVITTGHSNAHWARYVWAVAYSTHSQFCDYFSQFSTFISHRAGEAEKYLRWICTATLPHKGQEVKGESTLDTIERAEIPLSPPTDFVSLPETCQPTRSISPSPYLRLSRYGTPHHP